MQSNWVQTYKLTLTLYIREQNIYWDSHGLIDLHRSFQIEGLGTKIEATISEKS